MDMLKNTYLSGTESQESLPLRYEADGHRLRMASRASVAEVCVPYSFGRSRDFAGMLHSFGRSGSGISGGNGLWEVRDGGVRSLLLRKE